MKKALLRKRSKRVTASQKYKIQHKVREHHRKLRKEARKAKSSGVAVKRGTTTTRIPNSFPQKYALMEDQDLSKELEILKKNNKSVNIDEKEMEQLISEGNEIVISEPINNEDQKKSLKSKKDMKNEINSLINTSDIILVVLDARDPLSYRSRELENNIKAHKKRIFYILNKVDLVPR